MDGRQAIAAANDNDFHASRHRTLPILASVTPIANYPTKLRIFKTNASRYWQVRYFIKGRIYTQSLKTTNKQAAISAAKQFFHIKVADLYGEHVCDRGDEPNKFAELVQAALAFQQGGVQRGELSVEGLAILRNRLQKDILPFFGDMPVDRIGYQQVSDYIQLLSHRELSSVTIQQHLVAIRKIGLRGFVFPGVFPWLWTGCVSPGSARLPGAHPSCSPVGDFRLASCRLAGRTWPVDHR